MNHRMPFARESNLANPSTKQHNATILRVRLFNWLIGVRFSMAMCKRDVPRVKSGAIGLSGRVIPSRKWTRYISASDREYVAKHYSVIYDKSE